MRSMMTGLLFAVAATAAQAGATPLAGQPALDFRKMRGMQEGPLTQVLTLGSDHLSQAEVKPRPEQLNALLAKLEAFRPAIITHEGLSGEQCDVVERYKARYPGVYDDYCWGTAEAEKATGLTVPQATAAIEATLKKWPAKPTPTQRRQLAAQFLAANDRLSALVQWLRLPPAERRPGDGIDAPLAAILEKSAAGSNESIVLGVALAVRLGLERLYAVDDHTADSIQALAGPGFQPGIEAHWASGKPEEIPGLVQIKAAGKAAPEKGDYLAYYRLLNSPEAQRTLIDFDYGRALKMSGPQFYGRQYVAWFEARNLRMVANIRAAFGNAPGARVLNIVGASHKPYYDAYLDQMSDVQIIDAIKVLE